MEDFTANNITFNQYVCMASTVINLYICLQEHNQKQSETLSNSYKVRKDLRIAQAYIIINSIYLLNILLMLSSQNQKEHFTQKVFLFLYQYMDYLVTVTVILTFFIWIGPALIYYATTKLIQLARCILRMGNTIVNNEHREELSYAILKGNGRYLREQSDDVHKKQFYDYTSRRFMTLGKFQSQTKIIELQCQTQIGLQFFTQTITSGVVVGVHSNQSIPKNITNSLGLVVPTNYEIEEQPFAYDCLLLFNLKNKIRSSGSKADLLKILTYCRYHMDKSGYLVYGDYFQPGEISTYLHLFKAFNFIVADQEDLTKNIQYAKKFANKQRISFEQQFIDTINNIMGRIFGRVNKQEKHQFTVFILEKGE